MFCDDAAFNQPYRGTFYYTYQKHRIAEFDIQGKTAFNASSFHAQVGGTLQRLLARNRRSTKEKSEMVEYLQSKFREEEIANKVEFASFLKKRSEPIEAGSPEHFKASYWIIRYSRKKRFQCKQFSLTSCRLYNACLQEFGVLRSFPVGDRAI